MVPGFELPEISNPELPESQNPDIPDPEMREFPDPDIPGPNSARISSPTPISNPENNSGPSPISNPENDSARSPISKPESPTERADTIPHQNPAVNVKNPAKKRKQRVELFKILLDLLKIEFFHLNFIITRYQLLKKGASDQKQIPVIVTFGSYPMRCVLSHSTKIPNFEISEKSHPKTTSESYFI